MSDPLDWIEAELDRLAADHLSRRLADRAGLADVTIELDGKRCVQFAANDYLGLAGDRRLIEAAAAALAVYGCGATASPLICGHSTLHRQLEQRLAKFEETEAALVFPTGFAANMGTITALVGRGDAVFSDAKNHASIIDGCRLSGAAIAIYRHADVDHLANLLEQASPTGKRLIVTDGLFSMDGDVPPLAKIAELAEAHQAMLMVDEAHATGVLGPTGRGACELCGVEQRVDVRVGTLSKALGSLGGFVVGSRRLVDWLVNRSRAYIFSTAAAAAVLAAGLAALSIVESEPKRREQLLNRAADLRQRLQNAGLNTGASQSQIIPVILGNPERTMRCAEQLLRRGLFVPGIRPPSVPAGESLLRISLSANHTEQQIDALVEGLIAIT